MDSLLFMLARIRFAPVEVKRGDAAWPN